MRIVVVSMWLGLIFLAAGAQTSKKPQVKKPVAARPAAAKQAAKPKPVVAQPAPLDDKSEFEKASAIEDLMARVEALKAFLAKFPDSPLAASASELLSSSAYGAAEEHMVANEAAQAIEMFRLAAGSAPKPIPAKLFSESLSKIPSMLYWRGSRKEAVEIAGVLEPKAEGNAGQLAELSLFYAGIEAGDDAVGLAELAIKADAASAKAYESLGFAQRVNFRLEESAAAYAKALELDPANTALKRNLADIKRSIGKSDEAAVLYREVLASDAADLPSRNGYILALFDGGKTEDAEKELAKALDENPRNVTLLAGAAYWYAVNKKGERAAELAQRAIAVEPRYIWSHIALARGLMLQGKALEAEETLLKAHSYGNFATLEYELASARLMAGFYRDAVEALERTFSLSDDTLKGLVGVRVERKGSSFADVLADERRASIFAPAGADDPETAARLKQLMVLSAALKAEKPEAAAVAKAADDFAAGDDRFRVHRQLFAASQLLNKGIAAEKAFELAQGAVGNSDTALSVPNAAAAVMASELYESRQAAFSRSELLRVPDVQRQTLAVIVRGRIEEMLGWALLQQSKPAEAAVHFKRAVSILPDKSAWWRSSMWRLGSALQADGKETEALDSYIKSYSIDKPDIVRYTVVENLYKKLNGNTEGLEAKIGPNPLPPIVTEVAKTEPTPQPSHSPPVETPQASAAPNAALSAPVASPTPAVEVITGPTPAATPTVEAVPSPSPAVTEASPSPSPAPENAPTAASTPVPTPEATPAPEPSPAAEASPTPAVQEKIVEITPAATPTPEPAPAVTPEASPSPTPASSPEATPTPVPESSPSPTPGVEADLRTQPAAYESPSPTPVPNEQTVAKVTGTDPPRNKKPSPDKTPKPLFEPIIITIPKPEIPKANSTSKTFDNRPRLIDGQPVQSLERPPCIITVNQDRMSLINGGGTLSVLVGVDKAGKLDEMKYEVSSPEDISVTLESDMEGIQGRALYVIRSISEKTGDFRVTFYLPCGRKDIAVTVR